MFVTEFVGFDFQSLFYGGIKVADILYVSEIFHRVFKILCKLLNNFEIDIFLRADCGHNADKFY